MPENRIRKVDSSASSPSATLPFGGPQAAGVAYDSGRKGLILAPEDAESRRLIPETFFVSAVVPAGASASDFPSTFFHAPYGVEVVGVKLRHEVNGGSGSEVKIKKVASGSSVPAHGAGTDVLASAITVNSGATTVKTGTLHGTVGNRQLSAGDSLALTTSGSLTGLDNVTVVVELKRRPDVA